MRVFNILEYIFPAVALAIATVLLCFYLGFKRKRSPAEANTPATQDGNTSIAQHTISLPDDEDRHYDRFPPRYSTVDFPPPYSLFDPKLTSVWPGGPPPAYEMYPITLPLAPHHWMTPPAEPLHPTPPSSPSAHSHPQQQQLQQASYV